MLIQPLGSKNQTQYSSSNAIKPLTGVSAWQKKQQKTEKKKVTPKKTEQLFGRFGISKPVTTPREQFGAKLPEVFQPSTRKPVSKPLISKIDLSAFDFDTPVSVASAKPRVRTEEEKQEAKAKVSKVNETVGKFLYKTTGFVPLQYLEPGTLVSGKPQWKKDEKVTAGKFVAGFIDDAMIALFPTIAQSVKATSATFNIVRGLKTGAGFTTFHALLTKMKEETIEIKDLLVSFGLGFIIGGWEPSPMKDVKGSELVRSKKILNKYGIKNSEFKNPEILKTKWRDIVKDLHPDKGGSAEEFKIFVDAYNDVTSAGVNTGWKFADAVEWFNHLWEKKAKTGSDITKQADKNFLAILEKAVGDVSVSPALVPGLNNPQEVLDKIVNTPFQDTKAGKQLIKEAIQAKQTGQKVQIGEDIKPLKPKTPSKAVVEPSKPTKQVSLEQKVKPKKVTKKELEIVDKNRETIDKLQTEVGDILKKNVGESGNIEKLPSADKKKIDSLRKQIKTLGEENKQLIEKPAKKIVKKAPVKPTKAKPKKVIKKPAKKVVKVKPKTKAKLVPRGQVPVGEGKTKVSRLEARIKHALGSLSDEQIKEMGLATHREMNKKSNIAKASKYVIENPEEAMKVLTGQIDAPKGIARNSVLIAMQNLSPKDMDIDMANRLATLFSTRAGQEISILTEVNKNLPVNILSDIIQIRTQAVEKRFGKTIDKITKAKVKKGETMIKAPANWDSFLKEVRC